MALRALHMYSSLFMYFPQHDTACQPLASIGLRPLSARLALDSDSRWGSPKSFF